MILKDHLNYLRKRYALKAGLAYLVTGSVIIEVTSIILTTMNAPSYILKTILLVLGIGFPIWVIFSFNYKITSQGFRNIVNPSQTESATSRRKKRLSIIIALLMMLFVVIFLVTFKGTLFSNSVTAKTTKPPVEIVKDKRESIAVLAFSDMSPNNDQEYFSDGISEELLNMLSGIPELRVISRTSSFSFKGKNTTVQEIGKQLGVSHILEGSVRKSGNTFRITAKLINVEKGGVQLWSETYDRSIEDIFKIQDEIAKMVTSQMKATILGKQNQTANVEAYNFYLKARQLYRQRNSKAMQCAEKILEKSIALDSTYAASWILLSQIQWAAGNFFGLRSKEETRKISFESIDKALEIDPYNSLCYVQLSTLHLFDLNFKKSKKNIKKAMELEPHNQSVIKAAAFNSMVNLDERIESLKKIMRSNPIGFQDNFNMGMYCTWDGRFNEAHEAFEIYELHNPNSSVFHYAISRLLLAEGKVQKAQEEIASEPDPFWKLYGRNLTSFAAGWHQEADSLLIEFVEDNPNEAVNIADIYAFRGDVENAFLWLNKAIEIKDPTIVEAIWYNSFKVLYNDPRWEEFINKLGLPKDLAQIITETT